MDLDGYVSVLCYRADSLVRFLGERLHIVRRLDSVEPYADTRTFASDYHVVPVADLISVRNVKSHPYEGIPAALVIEGSDPAFHDVSLVPIHFIRSTGILGVDAAELYTAVVGIIVRHHLVLEVKLEIPVEPRSP